MAGSRLHQVAVDGVLAFEIDDIDPANRTGWSVVATGMPYAVRDPRASAELAEHLSPWLPGRQVVVVLPTSVVTGRRIEPAGRLDRRRDSTAEPLAG